MLTVCSRKGSLLWAGFLQKSLSITSTLCLYKPSFQLTHENLTLHPYQREAALESPLIAEKQIPENVIPSRRIFCAVKLDFSIF